MSIGSLLISPGLHADQRHARSLTLNAVGGFSAQGSGVKNAFKFSELDAAYAPAGGLACHLTYKTYTDFFASSFNRMSLNREQRIPSGSVRSGLSWRAGASLANGKTQSQLSLDAGLDARYQVFSWLAGTARLYALFYRDSAIIESYWGVRFPRVLLKGLSLELLYPAALYNAYTLSGSQVNSGVVALSLAYTFTL